jgi:hypothetical protein
MNREIKNSGKFEDTPEENPDMTHLLGVPKRRTTNSGGNFGARPQEPLPFSVPNNRSTDKRNPHKNTIGEPDTGTDVATVSVGAYAWLAVAIFNFILVVVGTIISYNTIHLPAGFKFSDLSDPISVYLTQEELKQALNTGVTYLGILIVMFLVGTTLGLLSFFRAGKLLKINKKAGESKGKPLLIITRVIASITPLVFLPIAILTVLKFIFAG